MEDVLNYQKRKLFLNQNEERLLVSFLNIAL